MGACKTIQVPVEVPVIKHDTTYISKVEYDSIYKRDSIYFTNVKDTVILTKDHYLYKYKILYDTIYKAEVDSVTVIKTVEVEKKLSFYDRFSLKVGRWAIPLFLFLLIGLMIYTGIKIYRH